MAVNERPKDWENRHTGVFMTTGGGKSVLLACEVPSRGVRAIFWDVDKDHNCYHYDKWPQFVRDVIKAHRSGKPFRLGWSGDDSPQQFEKWLQLYWEVLDGNIETYGVVEELADVSTTAGDATGYLRKVLNRSRKYGGVFVCATQRPQEISKTVFSACAIKYVGVVDEGDFPYMQKKTGLKDVHLRALKPFSKTQKSGVSNCCQYWKVERGKAAEYLGIDPRTKKRFKKHPTAPEF